MSAASDFAADLRRKLEKLDGPYPNVVAFEIFEGKNPATGPAAAALRGSMWAADLTADELRAHPQKSAEVYEAVRGWNGANDRPAKTVSDVVHDRRGAEREDDDRREEVRDARARGEE